MYGLLARGAALTLVVSFVGCGGSAPKGPPTAPVSGKIMFNGAPLDGATVSFITDEFTSVGKTGPDGSYNLPTGAAIGTNKVTVSLIFGEGMNPDEGMDEGQFEAMNIGNEGPGKKKEAVGQQIPPEFSDPTKTSLQFPVSEGGTDSANFDLKSAG